MFYTQFDNVEELTQFVNKHKVTVIQIIHKPNDKKPELWGRLMLFYE